MVSSLVEVYKIFAGISLFTVCLKSAVEQCWMTRLLAIVWLGLTLLQQPMVLRRAYFHKRVGFRLSASSVNPVYFVLVSVLYTTSFIPVPQEAGPGPVATTTLYTLHTHMAPCFPTTRINN